MSGGNELRDLTMKLLIIVDFWTYLGHRLFGRWPPGSSSWPRLQVRYRQTRRHMRCTIEVLKENQNTHQLLYAMRGAAVAETGVVIEIELCLKL